MSAPNPDATWTELIKLTQGVIQSLGLVYSNSANQPVSLPGSQVYIFKVPTDGYRIPLTATGQQIPLPCVQICPGRLEDVANSIQDFENTQVIYPVLVFLLFGDNGTLALNNDLLYWRQAIYSAFEDFPSNLAGQITSFVSDVSVWDCQITAQPVFDLAVWQKENMDFSWLTLNYTTTRSRGR